MTILLLVYILTTCACLGITYYVFKFCAMNDEGGKILLLILLSFVPVVNFIALMMFTLSYLADILIVLIEKQLKKRKQ